MPRAHIRGTSSISRREQQDQILRALEAAVPGQADHAGRERRPRRPRLAGARPAADLTEIDLDFLPLLVTHTRQGFYADPIYGGNRDRIGWKVIGFPGPASLEEVHSGRYTHAAVVRRGRQADKVREFHDGL